jgi:hypothetical protein
MLPYVCNVSIFTENLERVMSSFTFAFFQQLEYVQSLFCQKASAHTGSRGGEYLDDLEMSRHSSNTLNQDLWADV